MSSKPRRNVLFLAYHFPPLGGAGVQRSAQFARRLPALGFEPIVVTGPLAKSQTWPPLDTSLAEGLPAEARIHRLAGPLDPKTTGTLARLRARYLMTNEFTRRWVQGCVEAGRAIATRERIDVVLATMSPFASAEAGGALARSLGVPWVADLRDPWALDEVEHYLSRWHRRAALRRMERRLTSAAAVIANTPEAAEAMRLELSSLDPNRVVTITNGFDPADFGSEPPTRACDRFRIVHTGHLHTALGRRHRRMRLLRRLIGGERVPTDLLTRSHVFLLEALERMRSRDPAMVKDVVLVLAGHASAADREVVQRSQVSDLVQFAGYLAHQESVALLRSADLLFLPMHKLPPGERARIVPGKTYEYLAARRPILAAVPEGDARDFVVASGLGWVCEPDDVEGMARILAERIEAFRQREPDPTANETFLARFDRAVLAEQLAEVLECAIDDRRPSSVDGRLSAGAVRRGH